MSRSARATVLPLAFAACLLALVSSCPAEANPVSGPWYRAAPQHVFFLTWLDAVFVWSVVGFLVAGGIGFNRVLGWMAGLVVNAAGSLLCLAFQPPRTWIEASMVACVAVAMAATLVYDVRDNGVRIGYLRGMRCVSIALCTLLGMGALQHMYITVSGNRCLVGMESVCQSLSFHGGNRLPRSLSELPPASIDARGCLWHLPLSALERGQLARLRGLSSEDFGYTCNADAGLFTVFCNSSNHVREGIPPGYPQYTSHGPLLGVGRDQERWSGKDPDPF